MGNNIAIIFGINGQDGHYLEQILHQDEFEVIGVSRTKGNFIQGNVADFKLVSDLIKQHQPEFVFHLAANSTIRHDVLFENHETISTGAINILEAVYKYSASTKVFLSGSALQFVNIGLPLKETDDFEAKSPYSISRIQSVYAARYFQSLGLRVYIGYFFHHDSPLRSDRHLSMQIVKKSISIKRGLADVIKIGNLNITKEFNHAYDMMTAIWLLVSQDKIFEAVIGSGKGYSINDWVGVCSDLTGIDLEKYLTIDASYVSDFSVLVSNPESIKSLGWIPKYDLKSLASDMINNG